MILPGVVKTLMSYGIFIEFSIGIFGLAPNSVSIYITLHLLLPHEKSDFFRFFSFQFNFIVFSFQVSSRSVCVRTCITLSHWTDSYSKGLEFYYIALVSLSILSGISVYSTSLGPGCSKIG